MVKSLDFDLLRLHARYLQPEIQAALEEEEASETVKGRRMDIARNTFRLIKMLGEADSTRVPLHQKEHLDEALSHINQFSRAAIGRIEIVAANRSLERMYFPIPPTCRGERVDVYSLEHSLESRFIYKKVNWTSATEKVEEFCAWCEDVLINIEHKERLGPSKLIKMRPIIVWLALLLALLLNLLVIVFADTDGNFNSQMGVVLRVLGIFQLVLALLMAVSFFKQSGTPMYFINWKHTYMRTYQKMLYRNEVLGTPVTVRRPNILFDFETRQRYIDDIMPYVWPRFLSPRVKFIMRTVVDFLVDFSVDGSLHNLLYVLVVLLGITVHPFFYAFLLLDILRVSRSLRTVLVAVAMILKVLVLIGLLIFVIIWIYSLYVFLFIRDSFSAEMGQYCQYPLQCMISLAHIGISNAGQPMEFIAPGVWQNTGPYMGQVVFNISFFIVIGMILFNIIFAVIVDQFGQLRDAKAQFTAELGNKCFICSVEREVFQRAVSETEQGRNLGSSNRAFVDHVTYDHRPWDYLFFFEYLRRKRDPMTTNEEHVMQNIRQWHYLQFFPVGRAKVLEQDDTSTETVRKLQILFLSIFCT